jgi:hypothetical protein
MRVGCDRLWEVDAYRDARLGARDRASFERHLRTCGECQRLTRRRERLRELGQQLPEEKPTELALRRMRARVLRDAAQDPTPVRGTSWWPGVSVGFVLAILVLGVALKRHQARAVAEGAVEAAPSASGVAADVPGGRSPSGRAADVGREPFAGSVETQPAARWSHARNDRLERVELDDGTLRIHVRHQVPGERFLVELPDGELEVRGTTFEVSVASGTTTRVHVDEGVVELRIHGSDPIRLQAADEWGAPVAPSLALPSAPTPAAAPAPTLDKPVTSAAAPTPDTANYDSAMSLLRAGHNDDAAAAFEAFVLAHAHAPEAEDASFLEAVALARAGRADAAALAAEHHLATFPRSFHRKDASTLVARAAIDRGDCAKAVAVLADWADAGLPDPGRRCRPAP